MAEISNQQFQIEFNTQWILKFITHIATVSNVVTAISHATKGCTIEQLNPLETDGLALVFSDENGSSKITAQHISDWVLGKAFEDFIVGLTQSLVEIYIFLNTVSFADSTKTNAFSTEAAMQEALDKCSKKAKTSNFPTLIDDIEKMLNTPLLLKDQIVSINQVRNCFVHHGSHVKEKDGLILKYVRQQMHAQVNGELLPVTKGFKSKRTLVEKLYIEYIPVELQFNVGEKIIITPDVFKDVTFTCIWFFQELVKKLPITDEIKNMLAPPPVMIIATE